ncbi:MAG: hypothetical protein PWR29_960 [Methanolobus sp.]|nr:hypothetical protein [Methanolobus sp.]
MYQYTGEWKYKGNISTDSNGKYVFYVSDKAYYKVKFILPEGYDFSPKDRGHNAGKDSDAHSNGFTDYFYVCLSITDTVDAGMYQLPPATVGNLIWNDENNNGIQDEGEAGIEGLEVKLYKCTGEHVSSTTTDSTGYYEFTSVVPGSYYIEFSKPSGSVFSPQGEGTSTDSDADTNGITPCFTLVSGENNQDLDAGIYFPQQEEIPEFPTIALPVAAVLGLAFLMQRKKE